jgi:hypothetical protein
MFKALTVKDPIKEARKRLFSAPVITICGQNKLILKK